MNKKQNKMLERIWEMVEDLEHVVDDIGSELISIPDDFPNMTEEEQAKVIPDIRKFTKKLRATGTVFRHLNDTDYTRSYIRPPEWTLKHYDWE